MSSDIKIAFLTPILLTVLHTSVWSQSLYDYYLIKGSGLIARKDYKQAEFYLTKAVDRYPDSVLCYYHRGGARYFQQELDPALEDFNMTLKLDPENYEVFKWRGMIYHQKEQFELALIDYNAYLAKVPKDKMIRLKAAEVKIAMDTYTQAEQELKALLKEYPRYALAHGALGDLYLKKKEYSLAYQEFSTVLTLNPENAEAHFQRGMANQLQGRLNEACTDWRNALLFGHPEAERYLNANACAGFDRKPEETEKED